MSTPPRNPRLEAEALLPTSDPPTESVERLVEGALRFLEQGAQLDPTGDAREFTEKLERLRALARELSTDRDAPADVAETQRALYAFVEQRVHEALAEGTTGPVVAARDALAKRLDRPERSRFPSRKAV